MGTLTRANGPKVRPLLSFLLLLPSFPGLFFPLSVIMAPYILTCVSYLNSRSVLI
jgi:hypothetical protein